MTQKQKDAFSKACHRLRMIKHAEEITHNVSKTCRYYGLSRNKFYKWKQRYNQDGIKGLIDLSRAPKHLPHATKQEIVDQILYLRKNYYFGPFKMQMYLRRYHGVEITKATIYRILRKHKLNKLPSHQKGIRKEKRFLRYEKPIPGYQLQIDVKFLGKIKLTQEAREKKYYQYTAIDDCSRIRILKIYDSLNQKTSIQFTDYVLANMPFKINCIQTDNGSEFAQQYHWHLHDLNIQHIYIRPRTPRLNGKVERSHRIDGEEFYQLMKGKIIDSLENFNFKVKEWQDYYNFERPHGSLDGQTPFEKLQSKLNIPSPISLTPNVATPYNKH